MKGVVLISSVKGGTGKSLISINLAEELRLRDYKVGLLDADITSPYFKVFTKAELRIESTPDGKMKLPEWRGIKVFSMSLLGDEPSSMYGSSERQILEDVKNNADWGDLDYLIIDLPAGAEDVFRETLKLWGDRVLGGVAVMIPFAEKSARDLITLWRYYRVPILGLIENMCCVYCPSGERIEVFGPLRGEHLAKEMGVRFLGSIPLDPRIPERLELGEPTLPDDIRGPITALADAVVEAKPVNLRGTLGERIRGQLVNRLAKIIAKALIRINREIDIGGYMKRYGFPGGRVFALAITDRDGNPLVYVPFRIRDDKLVLIRGNVQPQWLVEVPVDTLADIARGYREVDGVKMPFDVKTAWRIGELKVYGNASVPMLLYVADSVLMDEELLQEIRDKVAPLLRFLG